MVANLCELHVIRAHECSRNVTKNVVYPVEQRRMLKELVRPNDFGLLTTGSLPRHREETAQQ
jgi:hypothetical protein